MLVPATLDLHVLFDALMDHLPLATLLDLQPHVGFDLDRAQLALQLAVTGETARVQGAAFERGDHGAVRFGLMPAIGELASEGQLLDVQEHLGEGLRPGPELDFSQTGRVDNETPARHR